MSSDIAIRAQGLGKCYHIYDRPQDRLKQSFLWGRKQLYRDFWALRDISFELKRGETLGIIGRNGAGKSTLLQMICGTLTPTHGEVEVNGRVSALLELGAGFNVDFTGKENVYMNASILGLSHEEIDARYDDIVSFADIGDFIGQPVKTYSSGMYVRLAFAVAISVEPDILVVDEALSVGDMFFQAKCAVKMKELVDNGVTLLFTSHDIGAIKSICQDAILLNDGALVEYDAADRVVEKYFSLKIRNDQEVIVKREETEDKDAFEEDAAAGGEKKLAAFSGNAEFLKRAAYQRIQNGKANFVNIQLLDEYENEVTLVEYDQMVTLRMAVEICEDIPVLGYGYHIRDKNGTEVIYAGSNLDGENLFNVKKGERYVIDWKFKMSLIHGVFNFVCVLAIPIDIDTVQVDFCDYTPLAVQFEMQPRRGAKLFGFVHWENTVEIEKYQGQKSLDGKPC